MGSQLLNVSRNAVSLRRFLVQLKIKSLRGYVRATGVWGAVVYVLSRIDMGNYKPGRITVLCVTRPLFSKDLDQLRKRTNINWITIRNADLEYPQQTWMPEEMRGQTRFQKYRGAQYEKYWAKSEKFGRLILTTLQRFIKIDAIMVSHVDYWQPEGLRLAGAKLGISYLSINREHFCLPREQNTVREYYTGYKFEGKAVAVFGEQTKKVYVNAETCASAQVFVTGPPRMDVWRDIPRKISPQDHVVLLSYYDKDYLAQENFVEVTKAFVELAKKYEDSGLTFFIKAKNKPDMFDIMMLCPERPKNVKIEFETTLYDLFPHSRCIIGFNSLAVVEALFSEAKIVVPDWSDAHKDPIHLIYNPEDETAKRAMAFPKNKNQFVQEIEETLASDFRLNPDWNARLDAVRRIYFYDEKLTASQKVEEFVLKNVDPVL